MECHRCPHNAQASTACLTCADSKAPSHKGASHTRIEGNPEALPTRRTDPEPPPEDDALDAARLLLARLSSLQDPDVLLIMDLCRGLTYTQAGRHRRLTPQGIRHRLKTAARSHPWLSRFIARPPSPHHAKP